MAVEQWQIDRAVERLREAGATRVVLFGSAVDSPEKARDLDLACAGIPLWPLLGLAEDLRRELGVPLDLVPLDPENPFSRHVERWGQLLYAA